MNAQNIRWFRFCLIYGNEIGIGAAKATAMATMMLMVVAKQQAHGLIRSNLKCVDCCWNGNIIPNKHQ